MPHISPSLWCWNDRNPEKMINLACVQNISMQVNKFHATDKVVKHYIMFDFPDSLSEWAFEHESEARDAYKKLISILEPHII